MPLRIVQYNDSILRKKGEKIIVFDAALRELAAEMIATMQAVGGIGLAAQQIGRALQLCVVDLRKTEDPFAWELDGAKPPPELFMPMVIANPVLTIRAATAEAVSEEGCLSFPHIRGDVGRPEAISVRYQDEHGVPHVLACDGLLARCIQHEYDHLHGILFIDRMAKKARAEINDLVKALAKETREQARLGERKPVS
jgi:peptide deformylase